MKVVVTGGAGHVGGAVVQHLAGAGHTVRVLGLASDTPPTGVTFAVCDIRDPAALARQVEGCDGIVHLAAIPSPSRPGPAMFEVNAQGTFNVFQAAADAGVRKVVQASSINALGFNYGLVPLPIEYLPIDESHPRYTSDPYSFTKETAEAIGHYFWRRSGIASVAFRLPDVYRGGQPAEDWWRRHGTAQRLAFERLRARPEAEVRQTVTALVRRFDQLRRADGFRGADSVLGKPGAVEAELWWLLCRRYDFWAAIDDRDVARACEAALNTPFEGSHPLFLCAADNATGIASEDLAQAFFPEVAARREPLDGTASLVSNRRARELFGFSPQYGLVGPAGQATKGED